MSAVTVTKLIVKRLHELLNAPVVPTDNVGDKPGYPFLSYKITTARIKPNGQPIMERELIASVNPLFEYDIKETAIEQPAFTISFIAYAAAEFDAIGLSQMALDTLNHNLYYELKDINAVVTSIEAVGDRSVLIVDNYEHRYGFDAIIRITSEASRIVETIENFNITGGINE
ncbi:hypothetical protein GH810_14460 [Acetobacterium paludosum]|uniref:Phage neck terminator protein gp12-like domain-containing protein n=1 Tax=Acetobacterium paludosum TaxID=52693 RepID=A0A923I3Y8_9FIRM|nr:hypothetical protein [Acetobacterium paludosum]MBC3889513.1 hypothetical protein [Acetobacterium paludosum]